MANIIKGIRFLFGKEKSCMWEDTEAVLRAGYWLIALTICIILLVGCSPPGEICIGDCDEDPCPTIIDISDQPFIPIPNSTEEVTSSDSSQD